MNHVKQIDKSSAWRLKRIIVFLCLLLNMGVNGQTDDSKSNFFESKQEADRAYIDSLNKVAFSIFRNDPKETRKIATTSLSLSKLIHYTTGEGKANNYIAMSYHITGSYDTAFDYYQKSLEIFLSDHDTSNTGKIYNNFALLFTHREYYNLALEYNLKSLGIAELVDDNKEKFHSFNNIGIIYEKLGEYDNAIESYNKALRILGPESDTKELYFYAVSNIGIINLFTQKYDSAENQLTRGLQFFQSINENYGISLCYRYLGELYIDIGNYQKAKSVLEKADEYATKFNNKNFFAESQFLMARLHFAKKEYDQAKSIFIKALTTAANENFAGIKIDVLKYLSKIDSIKGNYFGALKNFRAGIRLKDSLNSLKIQNQIAEFSIQYEILQKDQEISRLLQSEELKELKINKHLAQQKLFFVIMLAVGIFIVFGLYIQRKIKKKNTLLAQQNKEIENKNTQLITNHDLLEELVEQRTAELVKAKEKALESDRLKSAFLLNISHEIRTPMNGILGFTDLLTAPSLTSDEKQHYATIIQENGSRLLNTVTDLVEISKIETGQINLYPNEINVSNEISDICNHFMPAARAKGLQLICPYISIYGHQSIFNDKSKFSYILSNLVKNAIKYTHTGSIEIGTEIKNDEIVIYIKDTGIGIPAHRQQAIFNRFEQADIEDKQALQGSGLGLAISKAYIDLMGGSISVKSQEGKGSVFYVSLPFQSVEKIKQNQVYDTATDVSLNKKQLKILVVEDDETAQLHLSILLNQYAKEIIYTTTGTEAVELCRQNPDIDLVLMDIKIPGRNGYEATREIRKFNNDVVIIAQTAYALSGDREKTIEAGCDDYISKPVNKEILLAMIGKHF